MQLFSNGRFCFTFVYFAVVLYILVGDVKNVERRSRMMSPKRWSSWFDAGTVAGRTLIYYVKQQASLGIISMIERAPSRSYIILAHYTSPAGVRLPLPLGGGQTKSSMSSEALCNLCANLRLSVKTDRVSIVSVRLFKADVGGCGSETGDTCEERRSELIR